MQKKKGSVIFISLIRFASERNRKFHRRNFNRATVVSNPPPDRHNNSQSQYSCHPVDTNSKRRTEWDFSEQSFYGIYAQSPI